MRLLIVTSKFNFQITQALHRGCRERLQADAPDAIVKSIWVPGAFEIPVVVAAALDKTKYDAVICLGAIVRGETRHFDILAREVAHALLHLSVTLRTPLSFEVLAVDNMAQAHARCGITSDVNKGESAAQTALAMIATLRGL